VIVANRLARNGIAKVIPLWRIPHDSSRRSIEFN
jgi:hypothetical protein